MQLRAYLCMAMILIENGCCLIHFEVWRPEETRTLVVVGGGGGGGGEGVV